MNGRDTVLVIADGTDTTADRVCAVLTERDVPTFRFDTAEFPAQVEVDAVLDGGTWRGELVRGDARVDLERLTSAYVRRPRSFEVPAHLTVAERWHAATESRYGLGGTLTSLPIRYVNHPSRAADAAYKPRQLRDLRACGLITPPTLITNSPAAVRRFAHEHGPLICKSIAATVLHTGDTAHVVYTRRVADDDLATLDGVDYAAHLFQPFVESIYAIRLTVVGDRFLAVRIDAASERGRTDWRSDYKALSYEIVDVPCAIQEKVHAYMRLTGLAYGAFDLLVQADGTHVVLEVNPEGNYAWLEEETALAVTPAVADLLAGRGDRP